MINKCFLFFLVFLFSVSAYSQHERHYTSMISGRVISTEKEIVDFATVYLKGTNYGSYTDEKGIYHLKTVEEIFYFLHAPGVQTKHINGLKLLLPLCGALPVIFLIHGNLLKI